VKPGGHLLAGVIGALLLTAVLVHPQLETLDRFSIPKQAALAGIAAALAIALAFRARRGWVELDLGDVLLLAYAALGCVSMVVRGHNPLWNASWLSFEVALGIVFVATRAAVVDSAQRRGWLVVAALTAAGIVAVITLIESLGVELPWTGLRRPMSTLGNRNAVGGYLVIALPLAALVALRRRPVAGLALVATMVTAVTLTRSRSAWLGAVVALVIGAALLWKWRHPSPTARMPTRGQLARLAVAIGVGILAAVALPWPGLSWTESSPFASSLSTMAEFRGGSGKVRLDQHRVGLAALAEHPLLGVGPRQWDDAASAYAHAPAASHAPQWTNTETPNSDVLRVATELGVPALLCLLGFFAWIAWRLRAVAASWSGLEAACLAGSLAAAGVHAALDVPLFRAAPAVLIAMIAGLAWAPARARLRVPAPAVAAAAVVMAIVIGALGVARTAGAIEQVRADDVAGLQRSIAWFPRPAIAQRAVARAAESRACHQLGEVLDDAVGWTPYQWGVLRAASSCAEAAGQYQRARQLVLRAIHIEPHVSLLAGDLARIERKIATSSPSPYP
jgi:O-antigen ligase